MEAKHTPGPWEVKRIESVDFVLARDADGEPWTICYAVTPAIPPSDAAANARLIAAAPDLLSALQAMVLNDRHTYRDCHKAAVAAIAKATEASASLAQINSGHQKGD